MSHDVASDGFLGVRVEHTSCAVDLRDDLIRDDDGDSELEGEDTLGPTRSIRST